MKAVPRLLHLEDNPLDAELVRTRLALDGLTAEIQVVHRQADFVAAVAGGDIDAVLADFLLPALRSEDGR